MFSIFDGKAQHQNAPSTFSLCPLLDFFVHAIIFYRVDCVPFKLTSQKPTQTLISFKAYWHVLLKTCLLKTWPKHDPNQQIISVREHI
jgi:hypothetical protein